MLHLAHFHPREFVIGGATAQPENRGNSVSSCHHQKAIGKRREGAISPSVVLPSGFPNPIPRRIFESGVAVWRKEVLGLENEKLLYF